jgi:hypothetical protein
MSAIKLGHLTRIIHSIARKGYQPTRLPEVPESELFRRRVNNLRANPHLNDNPGAMIALADEIFGLTVVFVKVTKSIK